MNLARDDEKAIEKSFDEFIESLKEIVPLQRYSTLLLIEIQILEFINKMTRSGKGTFLYSTLFGLQMGNKDKLIYLKQQAGFSLDYSSLSPILRDPIQGYDGFIMEILSEDNLIAKIKMDLEMFHKHFSKLLKDFNKLNIIKLEKNIKFPQENSIIRKTYESISNIIELLENEEKVIKDKILFVSKNIHHDASSHSLELTTKFFEENDISTIISEVVQKVNEIWFKEAELIELYIKKFELVELHVHNLLAMSVGTLLKYTMLTIEELKKKDSSFEIVDLFRSLKEWGASEEEKKSFINKMSSFLEKCYAKYISGESFSTDTIEEFKQIIEFGEQHSYDIFKSFQDLCDLVDILISKSFIQESNIYKEICIGCAKQGIVYLEIRKNLKKDGYYDLKRQETALWPLVKGILEAEAELRGQGKKFEAYIILGIKRFRNHEAVFNMIKELVSKEPFRSKVCGIDVNGIEYYDNPKFYKDLILKIKEYNKKNKMFPLGITFHAGEIYEDKTLESSIRHIHELINLGINRIGHANILGITDFSRYLGRFVPEPLFELRDQAEYDLKYRKELKRYGLLIDEDSCLKKIRICNIILNKIPLSDPTSNEVRTKLNFMYQKTPPHLIRNDSNIVIKLINTLPELSNYPDAYDIIRPVLYTKHKIEEVKARQNFVLDEIKKKHIVIESNPTSNLILNEDITLYQTHSVAKFLKRKVLFSIGTDDPLLFDTTLVKEISRLVQHLRLKYRDIKRLLVRSHQGAFRKKLK